MSSIRYFGFIIKNCDAQVEQGVRWIMIEPWTAISGRSSYVRSTFADMRYFNW
jgi:hypothetical protein